MVSSQTFWTICWNAVTPQGFFHVPFIFRFAIYSATIYWQYLYLSTATSISYLRFRLAVITAAACSYILFAPEIWQGWTLDKERRFAHYDWEIDPCQVCPNEGPCLAGRNYPVLTGEVSYDFFGFPILGIRQKHGAPRAEGVG